MSARVPCAVCDEVEPRFTWTDTHGVAQCMTCGAPYRILHYEGEGDARRRVQLPPTCSFSAEELPFFRRCWAETKSRLSAVGLCLSFPGGYDVASREDIQAVCAWWARNKTAPDAPMVEATDEDQNPAEARA